MQFRKFGNSNIDVSIFGFGCMRFPVINNNVANIDEKKTARMVHYAIDNGVNYFDTAYPYHEGNSEKVLGKILKGEYRKQVNIATKLPCWLVENKNDFDKFLNEQLKNLQTDHIEFYLIHALFTERWNSMKKLNVLKWCEKIVAEGKVGKIGFSFHDSLPVFKEIIDDYDKWDFCQIQYNYLNENVQAGTEGLDYASKKGLPVVVMESLLGGLLANPSDEIQKMWGDKNPVDYALRWLWHDPRVTTVLSGVSTFDQLKDNIEYAKNAKPLTEEELKLINKIRDKYREINPIPCTKCRYCMPCPFGVDIPRNIETYVESIIHNKFFWSKAQYNWHIPDKNKASACKQCKKCESKCPQKIEISKWMPIIHEELLFKDGEV